MNRNRAVRLFQRQNVALGQGRTSPRVRVRAFRNATRQADSVVRTRSTGGRGG